MGVQSKHRNPGLRLYGAIGIPGCSRTDFFKRRDQSTPEDVPVRLRVSPTPPPLCTSKEEIHIERLLSFEHEVNRPSDFVGNDGKCFPFAVFADEPVMVALSGFVASEEKAGGFGESPFEMGIADFTILGAKLFPAGFSGTFN